MFFFLLGVLLSVVIYYKLIKPCSYWKEKGIPHLPSWPLVGSMGKVLLKRQHYVDIADKLYKQYSNERYAGYMLFLQQALLIRDPDLVKQITIKDFNHFQDHVRIAESDHDLIISKSLFFLKGQDWKDMRVTLSPSFTGSKMKNMYGLIAECAANFVKHFEGEVEVEMMDVFSKFTNDVIASAAFGISIDSMKEPNNGFFTMGTALSKFTTVQLLKSLVSQACTSVTNFFGMEIFPPEVTKFFRAIIMDNMKRREAEGIVRPDMIHLLMEARKGKLKAEVVKDARSEGFAVVEEAQMDQNSKQVELTDDHIVAQAMLFFFAGFNTVSTGLCFMAYELAINPEVQRKLQEEIDAVNEKYQGKIPYDVLLSMKYLDQVLSETLRLWPPVFEVDRVCVEDYRIEPKRPHEKPLLVEKGVVIVIPSLAIHKDPQYFPEPLRFNPERFSEENKNNILPGTYLPFGSGPRSCIGSRFAIMEIKTVIFHLLSKFDIVPIAKTQIPLKSGMADFNLLPDEGIWLGFKPRKQVS